MTDASTSENMSPELLKVAERAKREPDGAVSSRSRISSMWRPCDERSTASARMRRWAWMGSRRSSTGRTCEDNLQDLHERMKTRRYRHQPIRRVHIPKDNGKTRPIGISTFEDKIVQDALREVLEAIYEQDFLDCSYGFRPGRSAHDALRALDRCVTRGRSELDPGGRHRVLLRQHRSQDS